MSSDSPFYFVAIEKFSYTKLICIIGSQEKGHSGIYEHLLTLNADRLTVTDTSSIPTGEFLNVAGSGYDFRVARNIGQSIARITANGFDDNYCVTRGADQSGVTFVAR